MGNQMRLCCRTQIQNDTITNYSSSRMESSAKTSSELRRVCRDGLTGRDSPRMTIIEGNIYEINDSKVNTNKFLFKLLSSSMCIIIKMTNESFNWFYIEKLDDNLSDAKYFELLNISDEPISTHYILQELIGEGQWWIVKKAHLVNDKKAIVAVKWIKLGDMRRQFKYIYNEILSLKNSNHPYIIKFLDVFHDDRYVYIVTEYFKGVNLFDYMSRKRKVKEAKVAHITSQILKAIKYLHSVNICHRDLKLENVMIDPKTMSIKIIDFGYSRKFKFYELTSNVGTPYYIAPEVIRGSYGKEWDLWSVGVITYWLLSGEPPFLADNLSELYNLIWKTKRYQVSKYGLKVSPEWEDFVGSLMTKDVNIRLTASSALSHPWISKTLETNFVCYLIPIPIN